MKDGIFDYSFTLAAGVPVTRQLPFKARAWRIESASAGAGVTVYIGNGNPITRKAGQGAYDLQPFDKIKVESATAQTVVLTVSTAPEYQSAQVAQVNVTANIAPGATPNLPAPVTLAAATAGSPVVPSTHAIAADAQRLTLALKADVNNVDVVWLTDGTGTQVWPLSPGEVVSVSCSGGYTLANYNTANPATVYQLGVDK